MTPILAVKKVKENSIENLYFPLGRLNNLFNKGII